jgi:putative ABC transport system substrate-binding protein
VRRREFITLLGSAATWPLAVGAQQPAMPIVGFLHARSPDDAMPQVLAFSRGLTEMGFIANQNAIIEYHWRKDNMTDCRGWLRNLSAVPHP